MASLIKFGLTMELLLLSTGIISTFFMLKNATTPYYLSQILNFLKSFLSSPLYICFFINSVVILILTFSKFQHQIKKFLNVFLVEKDAPAAAADDDISIRPQAYHEEKEDYMPNRTNSAIAMDTVMSFFSRYNSHPPVFEDTIQDEMLCSSVKIDSAQVITTTLSQSQTSRNRLRDKANSAQTETITALPQCQANRDRLRPKANSAQITETATTLPQSQTSQDRLRDKASSAQTTTETTTTLPRSHTSQDQLRAKASSAQTTKGTALPQSQTSWDRLRAKANTAQTTTRTTLTQSQTSWNRLRAKIDSASQTSHNFPDISHLTKAREIVSPRSSNPPDHDTATRTNFYEQNIEEGELEDDSLEATWKAIIKKKELRKSLTFNDALSMSRIGGLRGDISVTTEESNKRFDDFIKKMNQERLLQRQESDQRAFNNNMLNRAR